MKYMVAVDDTAISHHAFEATLALMRVHKDEIFILSVIPKVTGIFSSLHLPSLSSLPLPAMLTPGASASQELKESSHSVLLGKLDREARAVGVNHTLVLAEGKNIGEEICKYVKELGINFLVLGKGEEGLMKKWLTGSVTNYCSSNAECNVVIVRGEHLPEEMKMELREKERLQAGLGQEEEIAHDITKEQVKKMEEMERKRRLMEEKGLEMEKNPLTIRELNRMEEEERRRRMREEGTKGEKVPEKRNLIKRLSQEAIGWNKGGKERNLGLKKLSNLEETERKRRIKEEGEKGELVGEKLRRWRNLGNDIISQSKQLKGTQQKPLSLKKIKKMEEQERLRRMNIDKMTETSRTTLTKQELDRLEDQERKRRIREEGKKGEKAGEKLTLLHEVGDQIAKQEVPHETMGKTQWDKKSATETKESISHTGTSAPTISIIKSQETK